MKHSAILAAALLAVSAPSFAAPSGVPEGRWRITGVDGKSASGTLVFDRASSRLHADAGCNMLSAGYRIGKGRLNISRAVTTLKACEPEVMAAEEKLSGALSAVRRYRLRETPAGAELVLADKYGKVRILAVKEAKDAPPRGVRKEIREPEFDRETILQKIERYENDDDKVDDLPECNKEKGERGTQQLCADAVQTVEDVHELIFDKVGIRKNGQLLQALADGRQLRNEPLKGRKDGA